MNTAASPICILNGIQRLVPAELELRLKKEQKKHQLFDSRNWNIEVQKSGLFIDLSQVRWVEMTAAGQLVLLVEHALYHQIAVSIAFPLNELSKSEQKHLQKLEIEDPQKYQTQSGLFESLKKLRIKTLNYLKVIQFDTAVECRHVPTGSVTKIYDFNYQKFSHQQPDPVPAASDPAADAEPEERAAGVTEKNSYNYRLIIPLTWIKASDQEGYWSGFEEMFNKIITQSERGLDHVDAQVIRNVVISELAKNVLEHSGRAYGLLGAALQATNSLSKPQKDGYLSFSDYLPMERPYFRWLAEHSASYLALFFGDSGTGLIHKLESAYALHSGRNASAQEQVLQWSFDKWSTCKLQEEIRGTKGIYRIHRIVNKYNGMVLIRSNTSLGGYSNTGRDQQRWLFNSNVKDQLTFLPGTVLKMYFIPYREILKVNTQQKGTAPSNNRQFEWTAKTITIKHADPAQTFSGSLALQKIFSSDKKNLLVIMNAPAGKEHPQTANDQVLLDHIKYLCLGRHPNGVVVYVVNRDWDTLEAKIDSLNQLIFDRKLPASEAFGPDEEDVYDPILILGQGVQYSWAGGDRHTIDLLTELYNERTGEKKLTELSSFLKLDMDEQTKVIQFVSNDNAIISMDDEHLLRINFNDIAAYFSALFRKKVNNAKQGKGGIYLTPNLRYINKWLDTRPMIDQDFPGYALALYLVYSRRIEALPGLHYKILIDNSDNVELAEQFAMLAGISTSDVVNILDEIDGRLPRRNPIFERDDQVIVLTTVISSTETIRRSVKSIQRDLAIPIAIIGLINQSEDTEITTWGKQVPIISLISDTMQEINSELIDEHRKLGDVIYIEPFSFKANNSSAGSSVIDGDVIALIESTRALHFNHFGKANGRHFTFYLSPASMLKDEALFIRQIIKPFEAKVRTWLEETSIDRFDIWMPTLDLKMGDPLGTIAQSLMSSFPRHNRIGISRIKRKSLYGEWALADSNTSSSHPSVLIIDWGALTGSTIQQMVNLATRQGKSQIFVCVLFSQFSDQEHTFYQQLNNVKVYKVKQADLFSSDDQLEEISARIRVDFIYKFPLKYYESFNCPVCEHIKALSEFEIKGHLMSDFSLKRRNRLKIKDKSIADESLSPQDFYADLSEQSSDLDPILITKMFKLRVLLQEAIESTEIRELIYLQLMTLESEMASQLDEVNSDCYALLYFLSVEIMWLQKPPLVFIKIRKLISALAIRVATRDREEMEKELLDNRTVIRYKFAAISVLRSSDKRHFCEHIWEMFASSKLNGRFSDNLTQNLFYHIHSLLQKQYHASLIYYHGIIGGLDLILNTENPNSSMVYVIQYLRNLANKRMQSIKLEGKSDLELVASLKKEIENYTGVTDHSETFEVYRRLSIENILQPVSRLDPNSALYPTQLDQIRQWTDGLVTKWGNVSGFIESVVNNHLQKLSHFYSSSWFRHYRIHEYFPQDENAAFVGYDDEFTKIINHLAKRPADTKLYYELYRQYYIRLLTGLFYSRRLNHQNDSKLISLLDQVPTDINQSLQNCIGIFMQSASLRPTVHFTPVEHKQQVFYPREQFEFAINQILSNVIKHRKELENEPYEVHIGVAKIENADERDLRYQITLTNTGTTNDKKNKNGALLQIKTEMTFFGANCTFDFDTHHGVKLTFLNYGD
ncbi:hypothetical protein MUGA111182_19860 [Mucilaginibacter galii]|uniref:Uncharacterized protein n=1 Tax=Mucilaginibacter galii TaxID=2005073 RepID=A0A917N2Z6_9SPHI|nr:hypothetical protein [Mucilaginibacter galii]GGI52401.1 hypothetical protein GCM10011425_36130 [Mucilaginibacter galii]